MGLPTALLAAKSGKLDVVGYDIDEQKLATLRRGELHFSEPGMPELFAEVGSRFRVTSELAPSDAFILALPTPITAEHRCDLSAVESATRALLPVLRDGDLVILESTVSPGTTMRLKRMVSEALPHDVRFAYVSEKAKPGDTLHEMIHNDRIVGLADEAARELTTQIYDFVQGELVFTSASAAEAAKLFENTFRDVNIALANDLANLAEEQGLDVFEVIELANRHPRVDILSPGPGVGGHCIAIDPWFLVEGRRSGDLVRAARALNDARPQAVVARVQQALAGLSPPAGASGSHHVAVLGLAYKNDVDDDRESPSYPIIEGLRAAGYVVKAHDPHVANAAVVSSLDECLDGASCVVLATDHSAYRNLDFDAHPLAHRVIVDSRGLWRRRDWSGYRYHLLGKPTGG
jgi:UDP-N-acetyl-D-mannosaminuronic acid dehydrogenase